MKDPLVTIYEDLGGLVDRLRLIRCAVAGCGAELGDPMAADARAIAEAAAGAVAAAEDIRVSVVERLVDEDRKIVFPEKLD